MGKLYRIILFLIPLFASYGYAATQDKMHAALQAFQAGEFEHALAIYEDLLQTPLQSWETDFIKYNIGAVYLASRQYLKSIAMLNSISLERDLSPLLVRNLKLNLAVTYLKLARRVKLNTLEAFSRINFDLWEAQAALVAAQEADCALTKAEGGSVCKQALDLKHLQEEIKVEFAKVNETVGPALVKYATLKEGLPMLLIQIRQMQQFANMLLKGELKGNLLKDYLQFGRMKGEEWMPLWEAQAHLLTQSQHKEDFLKAKELYRNSLKNLSQGQIKAAESSFEDSGRAMIALIHAAYGEHPLYEQMQKLIVFYQTALFQDPLQMALLTSLEREATDVIELLPADLKGRLDASNKALTQAVDALRKGNSLSRLFLLQAYRDAELFLREIRPPAKNPPIQILEDGIEDQRFAIILNRQLIKLGQAPEANANEEEAAQQRVVSDVEGFYQTVLKWQNNAFSKEGCQYQPWNEVLPLFDTGYKAALQGAALSGEKALFYQGRALDAWQEALHRLKHPPKSPTTTCKEAQKAQPTSKEQKERPAFEKTAGQLLHMDQEDRQPKRQQAQPIQVERPW